MYYLQQFSSSDPSSQSIRWSHSFLMSIHCSVVRHENEFSLQTFSAVKHYNFFYNYFTKICVIFNPKQYTGQYTITNVFHKASSANLSNVYLNYNIHDK